MCLSKTLLTLGRNKILPHRERKKLATKNSKSITLAGALQDPLRYHLVLRIRDVYPGSWFLPIPDPGSKNSNKREGWKKFVVITFYVATNFTKLHIILVWMCWRKKCGPIFKELKNFLPKKLSKNSQNYGFGIPDPGVKKAPDPGSGSATLVSLFRT